MKNYFRKLIVHSSLLIALLFLAFSITNYQLPVKSAHAQAVSIDVSYTYNVSDTEAVNGDILDTDTTDENQPTILKRSNAPYSGKIFGVLQTNSLLVYKSLEGNQQPVARSGVARVKVSNINGEIKSGDFITSSPIAGRGMRASQSGYVLGVALAPFVPTTDTPTQEFEGDNYAVGEIPVALRIEYAEIDTARTVNRLLELFNAALFKNLQDPERFIQIIRYVAAGIIIILCFIIGFATFSRSVLAGVQAIGRNPLARNAIQFSIILNIILTLVTVILGIIAAVVILRV